MTWSKFDDNFHGHPKTRRICRNPIAFMLHVLAINYCSSYDLDGKVDEPFVEDTIPNQPDRVGAVQHLIECGVWHENGSGWIIHDFLEYHPSRSAVRDRKARDAERKRQGRK
jgi:hypothetical protein